MKSKKHFKTSVPQTSKSVQKEIKRILTNNKSINIESHELPFFSSFVNSLISEQGENTEEPIPSNDSPTITDTERFTPEKNKEDFESSFTDPNSNPENFNVDGISAEITQQNMNQIITWANKLDEFANFLNDPSKGTSLHRILADSDRPGNLLRGVTRKASDSITRIAGEVEKLKEVLNTFIIMAPKKARDQHQEGSK